MQFLAAQGLASEIAESAAELTLAQVVAARGRYSIATSKLPPNWGKTKARVDLALLPRSAGAKGWYGVVELKWPGTSIAVRAIRDDVVQDLARVAFVETSNLNARFLCIGGTSDALTKLFDKRHKKAEREAERTAFVKLLPRTVGETGTLTFSEWQRSFPTVLSRIPDTVAGAYNGRLKATLLAVSHAKIGAAAIGSVYVWQAKRTVGAQAS